MFAKLHCLLEEMQSNAPPAVVPMDSQSFDPRLASLIESLGDTKTPNDCTAFELLHHIFVLEGILSCKFVLEFLLRVDMSSQFVAECVVEHFSYVEGGFGVTHVSIEDGGRLFLQLQPLEEVT